jgi:hypothetical protein
MIFDLLSGVAAENPVRDYDPTPHVVNGFSGLLTEQRHFGFKLVNSGLFRIAIVDQSLASE